LGDNEKDLFLRSLYGDEDDFFARELETLRPATSSTKEGQQCRSWSELFLRDFELNEKHFYSSIDELD
jgi:hypothetical protein